MEEEMLLMKIGTRIRELRKKKKLTQLELALRCKFEKARISRIETGKTNPTIKSLYIISQALEADITEFFPV